jgi:MerR family transcriptional regulator, light-induced transcriptional regulator
MVETPMSATGLSPRESAEAGHSGWAETPSAGLRLTERLAAITVAIEQDVLPRLAAAHRGADDMPRAIHHATDALLADVLSDDPTAALARVEALRDAGESPPALLLDLVTPVARRLGEMWTADACSFVDVTVGLWRLQQVVGALGLPPHEAFASPRRRVLLAAAPGEQHTLGLLVVAEFFRRAGWDVESLVGGGAEALLDRLAAEPFAVVGLTAGSSPRLGAVAALVRSLRQASLNRQLVVLLGGPAFLAHPELARELGADATAADGPTAVQRAESLVALRHAGG